MIPQTIRLPVPELTRSGSIQLNERVSLRDAFEILSSIAVALDLADAAMIRPTARLGVAALANGGGPAQRCDGTGVVLSRQLRKEPPGDRPGGSFSMEMTFCAPSPRGDRRIISFSLERLAARWHPHEARRAARPLRPHQPRVTGRG